MIGRLIPRCLQGCLRGWRLYNGKITIVQVMSVATSIKQAGNRLFRCGTCNCFADQIRNGQYTDIMGSIDGRGWLNGIGYNQFLQLGAGDAGNRAA